MFDMIVNTTDSFHVNDLGYSKARQGISTNVRKKQAFLLKCLAILGICLIIQLLGIYNSFSTFKHKFLRLQMMLHVVQL